MLSLASAWKRDNSTGIPAFGPSPEIILTAGRRSLLFAKGRGRGKGQGSGKGRGAHRAADDGPLPASGPNERICYPTPPDETRPKQGQVVEGTSFGATLGAIASLPEVKRVLELGTWYGGGSTVNLGKGIRDSTAKTLATSLGASAPADNCIVNGADTCCHSLVVTVEVFEPAWEHARRYLRDLPVWCVRGSTVAAEEMLKVHEIPPRLRDQHFKLYYQRDLNLMRRSTPQLHRLCAAYQFELVLIDGNEYTGWAEFNRVRTECKPMYLALHDTQTLKTQKIEEYLNANQDEYKIFLRKYSTHSMHPACELIGCKSEQQFLPNSAGWSIYQRVDGVEKSAGPIVPSATTLPAASNDAPRQLAIGENAVIDEKTGTVVLRATSAKLGRRLRRQAAKATQLAAKEKEAAEDDDTGTTEELQTWGDWLRQVAKRAQAMASGR